LNIEGAQFTMDLLFILFQRAHAGYMRTVQGRKTGWGIKPASLSSAFTAACCPQPGNIFRNRQ
jgi:hypothetical protein